MTSSLQKLQKPMEEKVVITFDLSESDIFEKTLDVNISENWALQSIAENEGHLFLK